MAGVKHRGNGQGTVERVKTNCWKAIVIVGYKDDAYKLPIRRTKSGFHSKSEALAYLQELKNSKVEKKERLTLLLAYQKWLPTHSAGRSTIACYVSAFKVFEDCWNLQLNDLDIDELQACLENCDKGIRTRQNAKACLGLIYKWAIPRGYASLNLAQYLKVGEGEQAHKHAFTLDQLEIIKDACGKVPFAELIYCQCYLGFRPSEFLALRARDYNEKEKCFVGGSKTEAGRNRVVTVSPKIQPIVDFYIDHCNNDYVFSRYGQQINIKDYRANFYKCLDVLGIQDEGVHNLTPHSCRHTFATLMKAVNAPDKDKLELIGHTTTEQLQYYQDVNYIDLRKITDNL